MATEKRFVCLANSRKLGGRCIAGIEMSQTGEPLGWLRPVSAFGHGEISLYDQRYSDGSGPHVLDIVSVTLLEPRPKDYQQENWLLDSSSHLSKVGALGWDEVEQLADQHEKLWINDSHTVKGYYDSISLDLAKSLTSSLRLIRVSKLTLSVFNYYNKRRVQGRFRHAGILYWLWVTDPMYEEPYKAKDDGNYELGECLLTISLSEPLEERNECYKLIAAIIPRP